MPLTKPFYVTEHGGSIHCIEGLSGRIFRACSSNQCTYTGDLHSAKSYLDFIENNNIKSLPFGKKNDKIPFQRKTTLKTQIFSLNSSHRKEIQGLAVFSLGSLIFAC